MSTEYIWSKRGKEYRRTADPEGKLITLVRPTPNTEIRYKYHDDGGVKSEEYLKNGKRHRDGDKPAFVRYNKDGGVHFKEYYKDGKKHRDGDKPAAVWYNEDGGVHFKEYYKDGSVRHTNQW